MQGQAAGAGQPLSGKSQGRRNPEHKGHSGRWVHKSAAATGAREPEKDSDSLKQHVADKSTSFVFSCLVAFNIHKAKRRPQLREVHEGVIKILVIYIMISYILGLVFCLFADNPHLPPCPRPA